MAAPAPFRQPLFRKVPVGGVTESQVNRWTEANESRPFEAGLDKGLKSWAALRRALASVAAGELVVPETIPARIKYRSGLTYYGDTLHELWYPEKLLPSVGAEEAAADEDGGPEPEQTSAVGAASSALLPQIPTSVTIIDPKFPALSIADFDELMRTATPQDILLAAYHHFHWRYFEKALYSGVNINMVLDNHTKKTLLFMAVEKGDIERVEYLLEHGANPNVKDHRGDTPLHLCMNHPIIFHPRRIATMLMNKGAQVNVANKRGTTPLHRAINLKFLDFVELLLKRKAKVYCFDNNKMMPFQYASVENKAKVAKLFNSNVRFCGKRQHEMMWAHIMSRQFVDSIFKICAPACMVCKRRGHECDALKKKDFRYWLYVHEVLAQRGKNR